MEQTISTELPFVQDLKEKIVHTTKDYSLFKQIEGNRPFNKGHFNKIKKSIKKNYLFTIIIVNEHFEIIDGQHRFQVLKELNLPVYYVICEGYNLIHVHILNQNAKTWSTANFHEAYCEMGLNQYIELKNFQDKYGFSIIDSLSILSGYQLGTGGNSTVIDEFKGGTFHCEDWNVGYARAEKIYLLKEYYEGYNRRSFVSCLLALLNNDNFNFDIFFEKLKLQPRALAHCTSNKQYLSQIEDIYNYRSHIKINLRY